MLNRVEKDFIKFHSLRSGKSLREIKKIYVETKNRFDFGSQEFRILTDEIQHLFRLKYNDNDEKEIIDTYAFYELLHLYRFLSYSQKTTQNKSLTVTLKNSIKALLSADIKGIYQSGKNRIAIKQGTQTDPYDFKEISRRILKNSETKKTIIVDYGCGLGYISYEIAKLINGAKTYLVDIDRLPLDFAVYRFKKMGLWVSKITIEKKNIYPKLPNHTICIATEVMEHIKNPINAFNNIDKSLQLGGILYGNFDDHKNEMMHISPNLSALRNQVRKKYIKIDHLCYRKIK